MARIEENVETWNAADSWTAAGEEWSGPWGGSAPQWWGSLLPRLHAFLPAGTVLELGPGHGRWTQYLKAYCDQLIVVDLAESCIDTCKARFGSERHISFQVNDGKSIPDVDNNSVDLVFSFDSLVHAEADALAGYASELARVLKPDGVAFIHHSNMAELQARAAFARRFPERVRRLLTLRGLVVNLFAWRAETVSAQWFATECERAGLCCIGQEKLAWEYGRFLTDAISVVTPSGSRWMREPVRVENHAFMDEARAIAKIARVYPQLLAAALRSAASTDPS